MRAPPSWMMPAFSRLYQIKSLLIHLISGLTKIFSALPKSQYFNNPQRNTLTRYHKSNLTISRLKMVKYKLVRKYEGINP
jgi:hypothetical protein